MLIKSISSETLCVLACTIPTKKRLSFSDNSDHIFSYEKDFKKSKETITVNGKKVKVSKITYNFTEKTIDELSIKMLEDLQKDSKFVKALSKISGVKESKIKDGLKDSIDEIKDGLKNADSNETISLSTYVKGITNKFVGYSINAKDEEEKASLSYFEDGDVKEFKFESDDTVLSSLTKKDNTIVTIKSGEQEYKLTINKKVVGKTTTYTIQVKAEDTTYVTATLTNKEVSSTDSKEEYELSLEAKIMGMITIKLTDSVVAEYVDSLDMPDTTNSIKIENITEEDIWASCKTVGIDHFIKTLPNSYDMEINEEKLLIEFNNKYKSNLSLDSTKIDVLGCNILDGGLCELCSINFDPNVEKLNLEDNIITNLSPLTGISFGAKLISLDLSSNKISSIDALSKVNFPLLNHLYLNDNSISSITSIRDFKFPNLTELNLSSNNISSIDSLVQANFPNLKELLLSKNEISSIDILSKVNFTKIKILTLDNNKISSIEFLSEIKFEKIREIRLEKNKLKNINILSKVTLPKLSYLSIGDDVLGDNLNELKEIDTPKLQDLFVYVNDKFKKNKNIQNIADFFENKGVLFNFIKYDKNGNQIFDKDINFMNSYEHDDDDDDDEDEDNKYNIIIEKINDNNFNDFLQKEGLL